jgi:hypothetical protein
MSKIVTTDYEIGITPNGTWKPGTPTYVVIEDNDVKISSKKVLVKKITWTMANCIWTGVCNSFAFISGLGTINSTNSNVKCNSEAVMIEGDNGTCNGSFTVVVGTVSSTLPCSCKFKIDNAGQSDVDAL